METERKPCPSIAGWLLGVKLPAATGEPRFSTQHPGVGRTVFVEDRGLSSLRGEEPIAR